MLPFVMCHAHRPSARAIALSANLFATGSVYRHLSGVGRIGHPLARSICQQSLTTGSASPVPHPRRPFVVKDPCRPDTPQAGIHQSSVITAQSAEKTCRLLIAAKPALG
jgi:hypothetical protein